MPIKDFNKEFNKAFVFWDLSGDSYIDMCIDISDLFGLYIAGGEL